MRCLTRKALRARTLQGPRSILVQCLKALGQKIDQRAHGGDWRNDVAGLATLFSNHIPDYRNLITSHTMLTQGK